MGGGHGGENRHSPLVFSLLEPALLILLKEQPRHGYTLLNELENLGIRTIHPSVVYRTLREFERLGWIQSDWDSDQTFGPPRRNYQLTVQGEETLRNWKQEMAKSQGLIAELINRANQIQRR